MSFKREKGITLIALIVTIVVSTVIVAASINAIVNEGIVNFGVNGVERYNDSGEKENIVLSEAIEYLKNAEPEKDEIVLSYNSNGGTGTIPDNQIVKNGQTANVEFTQIPSREGYIFTGWDTDKDTKIPKYTEVNKTIETKGRDITLYAIWGQETTMATYTCTKDVKEFKVNKTGTYKLEVWGAQGGSYGASYPGGYGGYATGLVQLQKGTSLWVCVGGAGAGNQSHGVRQGGYNGGGKATSDSDGNTRQGSGGGATHIAIGDSSRGTLENYKVGETIYLDEILIVAGGGGGSSANSQVPVFVSRGGSGGGIKGGNASEVKYNNITYLAIGGSQDNMETAQHRVIGKFGKGAETVYVGGGGGFYGGSVSGPGGGGGSGYIGNPLLTNKYMVGYNVETSNIPETKTYSKNSDTDISVTAQADKVKKEDGYAKISIVE